MRSLVALFVFAVALHQGDAAGTQYVEDGSVSCTSEDITFKFSHDSDLYDETQLQITLYTGSDYQLLKEYVPGSDDVDLAYDKGYTIVATTVYGSNARPLLYNIEQPFYAVPLSGKPRNYTFGVYCTVQAYDNINVTTNTTDNGHGDGGGDIINPKDHVDSKLVGTRDDGSSTIGDPLQYQLFLKDDTYAALTPVNCKYYNPSNEAQNLPFVSDNCPRPFPDDPDGYFGTIKQISAGMYQLDFRAFSFETKPDSFLGIDCDIQLCITNNVDKCNLPCWGTLSTSAPSTELPPTTATPPTTEEPTSGTASPPPTLSIGTTATTTTPTTTTTESTPGPLRLQMKFHPIAKRDTGDTSDDSPTTINDKALFKVAIPGVDAPVNQPVCDTSIFPALYAVIGILATLVAVLVFTLSYMIVRRRNSKMERGNRIYDGPYVPKTVC